MLLLYLYTTEKYERFLSDNRLYRNIRFFPHIYFSGFLIKNICWLVKLKLRYTQKNYANFSSWADCGLRDVDVVSYDYIKYDLSGTYDGIYAFWRYLVLNCWLLAIDLLNFNEKSKLFDLLKSLRSTGANDADKKN